MRATVVVLLLAVSASGCKKTAAPGAAAGVAGALSPASEASEPPSPAPDPEPIAVGAAAPEPEDTSGSAVAPPPADHAPDAAAPTLDAAAPAPAAQPITIFVTGLAPAVTADDVKVIFQRYGEVVEVKTNRDHIKKDALGMAQVKMSDAAAGKVAIEKLNGTEIQGAPVKVYAAK